MNRSGPGMFVGTLACPFGENLAHVVQFAGVGDKGCPDLKANAAPDEGGTVPRPVPWTKSDFKVASVMCEPVWANGSHNQEASPRYVARLLCERLEAEHNLKIKHASEMEFVMFNEDQ